METTTLGRGGPVVSRAGLGLMGMSGIYGQADDQESLATIHAAVDAGITLLDTGDFYGMGHNELLLRDALRRGIRRESVFIQVKFGGRGGREHRLVHAADHDLRLESGGAQHGEPGRRGRGQNDVRHGPDPRGPNGLG